MPVHRLAPSPPRAAALGLAVALAVALEPALAVASPTEEARELVYRGDDLCLDGRYEEALHTYQLALGLVDAPTTRIEVAKTLFALGRWLEAYEMASSIDAPPEVDEPSAFVDARSRAHALRLQIDERIPTVRVVSAKAPLPTSTGVVLSREGREIEGNVGTPIRVDPGTYVLEVEDGGQRDPLTVTVREGESKTVSVEGSPIVEERTRFSPIAAVALGVAGGGLIVGSVAGGAYLVQRSELADRCAASAYACLGRDRERVDAVGWVANTGFIVFGVAGSVGVVAAIVDRKAAVSTPQDGKTERGPRADVRVGPGFLGVAGTF